MKDSEALRDAGVLLEEVDGTTVAFSVSTPAGPVLIMAEVEKLEGVLVLHQVHVSGTGLTRSRIREVARALGVAENVSEVVLQGSRRVSGRFRGKVPSTMRIKVSL